MMAVGAVRLGPDEYLLEDVVNVTSFVLAAQRTVNPFKWVDGLDRGRGGAVGIM